MGNNRCVVVVYFAWVTVLTFTIHHQRNVRPPQTQKLMRQDGSFSPCVQTKRVCLTRGMKCWKEPNAMAKPDLFNLRWLWTGIKGTSDAPLNEPSLGRSSSENKELRKWQTGSQRLTPIPPLASSVLTASPVWELWLNKVVYLFSLDLMRLSRFDFLPPFPEADGTLVRGWRAAVSQRVGSTRKSCRERRQTSMWHFY